MASFFSAFSFTSASIFGFSSFCGTSPFWAFSLACFCVRSFCCPLAMPKPIAPIARNPRTSTTATAALSLLTSMAFSTPSVRAATLTGITACPCRTQACGLDRGRHHRGRHACRRDVLRQAPPPTPRPTRRRRAAVSRFASISLALASRLATVPSGQPNWRATSLRVRPSRSHRTMTAR